MNKFIIAYKILYEEGEMLIGTERFNSKPAARTFERFLDLHKDDTTIIYDTTEGDT